MLLLINTNRMLPPIAPIGLDYIYHAAQQASLPVEILDLCLADHPAPTIAAWFQSRQPRLIGLTLRNVDDCFWPSGKSFLPDLAETIAAVRRHSDAPIVLGGVGFSIFPREIMEYLPVEFGIHGDGEQSLVELYKQLTGARQYDKVPGLLWRQGGQLFRNPPAWPDKLAIPVRRDGLDNPAYFRRGGQLGLETKRGCPRGCLYCADPLAKGHFSRLRPPADVADEVENLLAQQIDVLHLCDAEFNIPRHHALEVCHELIRRSLGRRVRWYAYLAVVPFDDELAAAMQQAGCVGINFTVDSASPAMLQLYRQPHRPPDIEQAVLLCRRHGITVMIDLLLGGPGETRDTLAETIRFMKQIGPDCVGAGLGVRLYPGTQITDKIAKSLDWHTSPALRRHYDGPINLLQPTFYISELLGDHPAEYIRELIAGDPRFFPPMPETPAPAASGSDHNYSDNLALVRAIEQGRRGAYWDILRTLRP